MQASEITVGMEVRYSNHPHVICEVISSPREHNGEICVLLRHHADYVPIAKLQKIQNT